MTSHPARALVAHESLFGNTAALAVAIARGLTRAGLDVDLLDVTQGVRPPRPQSSYDLLVVGAPTHAFTLSRASTRAQAVEQGAPADRAERGLRDWFEQLGECEPGAEHAAAFDTRVAKMRHLPGSAAAKAARVLHRHGYHLLDDPTSFYVTDAAGPLVRAELVRTEKWGTRLAVRLADRAAVSR